MNILFITSNRLGDAVLSTGLLDHIIHKYPQASITIACGALPASLFEAMPKLNEVIVLKKQKHNRHWLKLWQRIYKVKWDIVVDLRNSIVSRLILAKKRYIYGNAIDKKLHKVEQAASLMKLDNVPSPVIWVSDSQKLRAENFIPDGGAVIGVGPTANWIGKTWPHENFIELVEKITAKDGVLPDARVAIFAAPGEEDGAYKVLHSIPENRQLDIIAKTDPGTAAATLKRCALYIGNDSGLMHCAAAAGITTIGLFGPSYPHLYRPWGKHSNYAQTPKNFDELIDFAGYNPKTLDKTLMTGLDVNTAIAAVNKLMSV